MLVWYRKWRLKIYCFWCQNGVFLLVFSRKMTIFAPIHFGGSIYKNMGKNVDFPYISALFGIKNE